MMARVLLMRKMGVLTKGEPPPVDQWAAGMLEFANANSEAPRRLVLRLAQASPDRGVVFELIRPELVGVIGQRMRLRGIESVPLGGTDRGAMIQEWLVELTR